MQRVFLIHGKSGVMTSLNQIFISPSHQCLPVKTIARKTLSTDQGVPVSDMKNSLTAGQRGSAFLQDVHLIEKEEMTK
jgi:hypothetical protein